MQRASICKVVAKSWGNDFGGSLAPSLVWTSSALSCVDPCLANRTAIGKQKEIASFLGWEGPTLKRGTLYELDKLCSLLEQAERVNLMFPAGRFS